MFRIGRNNTLSAMHTNNVNSSGKLCQ